MAWLAGYNYRRSWTVQQAYLDSDLTNFPLLLALTSDNDLGAALATGYDLRVTGSDGTTLQKYERDVWSGGGGSAATMRLWTKTPTIASTGTATSGYLYWGKSGDSDGQDAANVWDANFKLVLHLGETSGSTAYDSTSGGHNGTYQGNLPDGRTAAGVVGNGQDLDGTGDYIVVPDHADLRLTTGATVECWGKKRSDDPNGAVPWISKETVGSNGYMLWMDTAGGSPAHGVNFFAYGLSATNSGAYGSTLNTRYYWAGVYDGSRLRVYRDGTDVVNAAATGSISTNTRDLWIGRYHYSADSGYDACQDCEIDEVRISNTGRSAAWLKFTYRNITESDNEITWGSVETSGNRRRRVLLSCAG